MQSLEPAAAKRKPLMLTEFNREDPEALEVVGGVRHMNNRHVARYEHGLYLAHSAIEALRCGASGALVWCLTDTYYDATTFMKYGLWQYKDAGWKPRPGYFAWSLLTRYTVPGSQVLQPRYAQPEAFYWVPAVALRTPAGRYTIVAVNLSGRPLRLSVDLAAPRRLDLKQFEYTRAGVEQAQGDMLASSQHIQVAERSPLEVTIATDGFLLLTDID